MRRKAKRRLGLAGGHHDTTFITSLARTKAEDSQPSRQIMAHETETSDRKGEDDMGSKALEAILAAAKAGETTSRTHAPASSAKAAPYAFAPDRAQYATGPEGEKLYQRDLSSFEFKVRDGKVRDAGDLPQAPERKSYGMDQRGEDNYQTALCEWENSVGAELLQSYYGVVDDDRRDRAETRDAYNGYTAPADAETKAREEQYLVILQHHAANGDIQAAYKLRELTARRVLAVR